MLGDIDVRRLASAIDERGGTVDTSIIGRGTHVGVTGVHALRNRMHVFGFEPAAGDAVRIRGEIGHVDPSIDHVHRVVGDVFDVDVVTTQWGVVALKDAILKTCRFGVFG